MKFRPSFLFPQKSSRGANSKTLAEKIRSADKKRPAVALESRFELV